MMKTIENVVKAVAALATAALAFIKFIGYIDKVIPERDDDEGDNELVFSLS